MDVANFDRDLDAWFDKVDIGLTQYVPDMIAETATEEFKDSFETKSFDGVAWPAYGNKNREPKRGSLMRRSNNLVNSIRPTIVTPSLIRINAGSSKVPYARIHNEGEHVIGKRKIKSYYNSNFMGKNKSVQIKAHSRSVDYIMPKRQFMGKSQPLLTKITTRFNNTFKDQLR